MTMEVLRRTLFMAALALVAGTSVVSSTDVIQASTIKEPPYVNEGNGGLEGYIPDLMDLLEKKTGKQFELNLVPDGRYGSKASNGNWNGMIGQVVSGRAEIAVAPITVSADREEVIDFSEPFMEFNMRLVMLKGHESGISTVAELAAKPDIQLGVVQDGVTESFFEDKSTSDADFRKLWDNMKKPENRLSTISDGVDRIRSDKGKFATFMEASTAKWWVSREACDLAAVDLGIVEKKQYALAIKKGSPLLATLNTALKELKQEGELERLFKKWWEDNSECTDPNDSPRAYLHSVLLGLPILVTMACTKL